jgi:single-stranded-DNA-specific exonuclease
MQKKIIRRQPEQITASLHANPVLDKIYSNRGIKSNLELEYELSQLISFQDLMGIQQAVECLADAIKQQKKILIVGDFDADGATSTAVAVRALKSFGAQRVNFLVPNRFSFGYGLTPELVDVAARDFQPDLIVTVDNGIANHAGVLAAKKTGIQVIITDHHLPGEDLPSADVIINPNQIGDSFPSKDMAGVGVIFYVMLALRRYLSEQKWFQQQALPEPIMSTLLDLVALGTVADVVPLDHNNRILIHQGLRRIRSGHCAVGITAILEIAGRNPKKLTTSDLGFAVAPRLNAAGRLDDMSLGIECLLCDDLQRAREIATLLNQLNEERRVIEQDMQDQALQLLKKIQMNDQSERSGICLFAEDWHQGVIGILASRIKDRLQRPVVAFALGSQDELKGSARSIPGIHIRDILADISVRYPELIFKFGGHAMAAGLTLKRNLFDSFSVAFDEAVSRKIRTEHSNHIILSDGELQVTALNIELADALREAGPWGQSFPEPLFDGVFQVLDQRLVGGKHLKLTLKYADKMLDAIAFFVDLKQWPNHRCKGVRLAYRLDINEFRGKRSVQLIIEHLEAHEFS